MKFTKMAVLSGLVFGLATSAVYADDMMGKGMGGKGMMNMSEEEMTAMKTERFGEMDLNGDGELSFEEMAAGPKGRFAETDTDGDGFITAEEISAHMVERAKEKSETMAAKMIERMDSDGDGKISQAEIDEKMKDRMPSEEKQKERFEKVDADGNGTISLEEFLAMKGPHGDGRGKGKRH